MSRITDTLDITVIATLRQALGNPPFDEAGPLDTVEAGCRLRRARAEAERLRRSLRACVLHDVPIVAVTDKDLAAAIGAPPEKETDQ